MADRIGRRVRVLAAGPGNNVGGTRYTLPQLQNATSFETHGRAGDPLFEVDPDQIDSAVAGFRPKSTSPAIDAATDLGYASDILGGARKRGPAPDAGAIER